MDGAEASTATTSKACQQGALIRINRSIDQARMPAGLELELDRATENGQWSCTYGLRSVSPSPVERCQAQLSLAWPGLAWLVCGFQARRVRSQ